MGVYGVNGEQINAVFGTETIQPLSAAYDIEGNAVFPPSPLRLKVMTYNVGEWYYGDGDNVPADKDAEYFALQSGMIERNNPDVLLIQEYWQMFSKIGRTAMSMLEQFFPYVYPYGGASGYYGHCVCSKYPISDYTEHTYTDNNNRYYDSCTITVVDTPITFVNTHLDLTQAKRDTEIAELIAFLESQTMFVACGDYNTGITPPSANTASTEFINNVKPFIDAGFHTANFGAFGFLLTCVDRINGTHYYLDNIYTSGNITIISADVDETKLNDGNDDPIDHMPMIAVVNLAAENNLAKSVKPLAAEKDGTVWTKGEYQTGDRKRYPTESDPIYINKMDHNTYAPDVYGWELEEEESNE